VRTLLLALMLPVGLPEGWVALATSSITPEVVNCANRSHREWAIQVSSLSVLPVPASDERRQDALPFPISFRGAIPFDGELPKEVVPDPETARELAPGEPMTQRTPSQAEQRRSYAAWALTYGEKYARRYVVRLTGGWLIGFGGGEYGGSLWWYAAPGSGRRIAEGNVIDIIQMAQGREALVFVGLTHMGLDEGRVFGFTTNNGRPELHLISDLAAAPQAAIAESEHSALVLTTRQLWRVPRRGKVERLCDLDSRYLLPRSMAVLSSNDVWVGMRHFVVRIRPNDGGETCDAQWFVPADCTHFVTHGEECTCSR
jgi:hypothetical protein